MMFHSLLVRAIPSVLLLAAACSKRPTDVLQTRCDTPWLPARIAEARQTDRGLDSVVEFRFRGTTVYLFSLGFVYDGDAPVYRCDGSLLCRLGGFAGNRMCDGAVFADVATEPKTVWRK